MVDIFLLGHISYFQVNGIYDKYTPARYFYEFDYNNAYVPNIEILNVTDYVSDAFIYDSLAPKLTYIEGNQSEMNEENEENFVVEYNKINVKIKDDDLNNFNLFLQRHQKSLLTQNSTIKDVKIKFVIWTPNNEKSVNPEGWELPDDYYGVDDKRIIQTPYYFKDNNRNLNSKIWDPYFDDINGNRNFGYNIDASGTIVKEFTYYKYYINSEDVTFDISFDTIFFPDSDDNTLNYIDNLDIPNPYLYSKNGIFGIPYLSRWEFTVVEDKTFIQSIENSVANVILNNTYDTDKELVTYNQGYPVSFYDEGGINSGYGINLDRQIVFDAGIEKYICVEIIDFKFNQTFDGTTVNLLDRLSMFVSDDNITFTPVQFDWMYRSSNFGGDNNGDENGPNYLNNLDGNIFPADKTMALKTKYTTSEILPDASFNDLRLINLGKRYVKFRFVSSSGSVVNNDGWDIKIFTCKHDNTTLLSNKIIYQEGGVGNTSTDFNYKFNINSDIYLELDKSIKQENPGILDYKDFKNEGIFLGFAKQKSFYIIKVNNILWQFVIKKPPEGYVFDVLDESGNKISETTAVLNSNIYAQDFSDLTFNENIIDNTIISGVNMILMKLLKVQISMVVENTYYI